MPVVLVENLIAIYLHQNYIVTR